jgi:hypothetical protein
LPKRRASQKKSREIGKLSPFLLIYKIIIYYIFVKQNTATSPKAEKAHMMHHGLAALAA